MSTDPLRGRSRQRVTSLLGSAAVAALLGAMPALAQAPAFANVCTGLGVGLPALRPIGAATSGILGGVVDPVINGVVGNINTDLVGVLSGRTIGVGVLDGNGNLVSVGPSDCHVAASSFNIDAQTGITVGGGRVAGLGGAGNATASAGSVSAVAIGNGAATANGVANAVAVGAGASVGVAGGVAIGSGSVALRGGLAGGAEAFSGASVASAAGAMSVGTVGAERQITNVAGGTAATDAVNLRQLGAVGTSLAASLGGGASFATDGTFAGPRYAIRGTVYGDVGSALAAMADDPSGLVRQDSTTRAITIGANADGKILSIAGTAGDRRLGGVADGIATNDAATVGQMRASELRLATMVAEVPVRANNALGRALPSATGSDALAVGLGATASGTGATAVGNGAKADQAGSTAIGNGAVTTRPNQVALGTARSTYTMAGIASAESAAAQSGPTRFVSTDAAGNLAASPYGPSHIAALEGRVNDQDARIAGVTKLATEGRREARQGVAASMAMTNASMPSAAGRTSWVMNTATFRGEWAAGGAVAHRLDTAVPLAVTAGYAYGGGNSHGVRVGLGGEF